MSLVNNLSSILSSCLHCFSPPWCYILFFTHPFFFCLPAWGDFFMSCLPFFDCFLAAAWWAVLHLLYYSYFDGKESLQHVIAEFQNAIVAPHLIGMFQFLLEMITGPVKKLFIPINHLLPSCPPFLRSMARGSYYEVIIGNKGWNS